MRLIDADALRIYNVDLEHGCTVVDYALAVIKSVSEAPTIDAEPVRHGTWETRPNPQWKAHNELHCSACGWHIHCSKLRSSDNWAYCPNCGAKMDGGGER